MLGRTSHLLLGLVSSVVVLLGCTGAGPTATVTSPPTAPATATAGPTTPAMDVCTMVPESDVIAKASYPIPFDKSESEDPRACAYFWVGENEAASITIGVESYGSADEVHTGIKQYVDGYKADNWPTEQLNGLGDEAWWLCQVELFGECTMYVRHKTYQVSVQTTPSEQPPLSNDLRKGVATELVKLVMGRLP